MKEQMNEFMVNVHLLDMFTVGTVGTKSKQVLLTHDTPCVSVPTGWT